VGYFRVNRLYKPSHFCQLSRTQKSTTKYSRNYFVNGIGAERFLLACDVSQSDMLEFLHGKRADSITEERPQVMLFKQDSMIHSYNQRPARADSMSIAIVKSGT